MAKAIQAHEDSLTTYSFQPSLISRRNIHKQHPPSVSGSSNRAGHYQQEMQEEDGEDLGDGGKVKGSPPQRRPTRTASAGREKALAELEQQRQEAAERLRSSSPDKIHRSHGDGASRSATLRRRQSIGEEPIFLDAKGRRAESPSQRLAHSVFAGGGVGAFLVQRNLSGIPFEAPLPLGTPERFP